METFRYRGKKVAMQCALLTQYSFRKAKQENVIPKYVK
jgi:hypothetical protein